MPSLLFFSYMKSPSSLSKSTPYVRVILTLLFFAQSSLVYGQNGLNNNRRRSSNNNAPLARFLNNAGFDAMDRQLLLAIIEKFEGGPVGLETLAAALGEDAGTLEEVYEPYLLREGFLQRTPRGRVATGRAYAHFGRDRKANGDRDRVPQVGLFGTEP